MVAGGAALAGGVGFAAAVRFLLGALGEDLRYDSGRLALVLLAECVRQKHLRDARAAEHDAA